MLAKLDLAPSQVCFDGAHFRATPKFLRSILSGEITIGGPISRWTAARRTPFRLAKYVHKGFTLLHPSTGGVLGELDDWRVGPLRPNPLHVRQGLSLLLDILFTVPSSSQRDLTASMRSQPSGYSGMETIDPDVIRQRMSDFATGDVLTTRQSLLIAVQWPLLKIPRYLCRHLSMYQEGVVNMIHLDSSLISNQLEDALKYFWDVWLGRHTVPEQGRARDQETPAMWWHQQRWGRKKNATLFCFWETTQRWVTAS